MSIKIPPEKALERAREVQPEGTEIIELRCSGDGQWTAVYMPDQPPIKDYERICYKMLECPLFNYAEI